MNENQISIQKALDTFDLNYSDLDINKIKEKFREKCKKVHPDLNNNKEIEFSDIDLLQQYRDILLEQCIYENKTELNERIRKIEEKDVFMTNKVFCEECKGYGTVKRTIDQYQGYCEQCEGHGQVIRCFRCDDGIFVTKSGKKVKCLTCKGTGIFSTLDFTKRINGRLLKYCPKCKGRGRNLYQKIVFEFCHKCNGEGYTTIQNPIFKERSIF